MTFGQWLTTRRERLRLRPVDCAREAGMTPQQWSDMENDRSRRKDGSPTIPTLKTLRAVARGLGIPEAEAIRAATEAGAPAAAGETTDAPFLDEDGDGPGIEFYYEGLPPFEKAAVRDMIKGMWERHQRQQTTHGKKAE